MVAKGNYYCDLIFFTEMRLGISSDYFDSSRAGSILTEKGYYLKYNGLAVKTTLVLRAKTINLKSTTNSCGYQTITGDKSITRTRFYGTEQNPKYPFNDLSNLEVKLNGQEWFLNNIIEDKMEVNSSGFPVFTIKKSSPFFRLFYLVDLCIEKIREFSCDINILTDTALNQVFINIMDKIVCPIIIDEVSSTSIDFIDEHHQLSYLKHSVQNDALVSLIGYPDPDEEPGYTPKLYFENYREIITGYFELVKKKYPYLEIKYKTCKEPEKDVQITNCDPDATFLYNFCNMLKVSMEDTNMILEEANYDKIKVLIPLIGFFIPEINPERGKIFSCEKNVDGIPRLYLKQMTQTINIPAEYTDLFKKAYYWDFLHDYKSGIRNDKLKKVEKCRLNNIDKSSHNIDTVYQNIFNDVLPNNISNVENELLELIRNDVEEDHPTYYEILDRVQPPPAPHVAVADVPEYWINNASSINYPDTKICTYGSMLDAQGNCGNCILYIPTDTTKWEEYGIYINKLDDDIVYNFKIIGFYEINIKYKVIRLIKDKKFYTKSIPKQGGIDCFICILLTSKIEVTFTDGEENITFDYLKGEASNGQNVVQFHTEKSYTRKEQTQGFAHMYRDIIYEENEKKEKEKILDKILSETLSLSNIGETDNIIIYGTQGTQEFCSANKVAENVDQNLSYSYVKHKKILRGNYFKKYMGDHLQELELLCSDEPNGFFGLLNNDRPSAARIILLSNTQILDQPVGKTVIKHLQKLSTKYREIVNFKIIGTGGGSLNNKIKNGGAKFSCDPCSTKEKLYGYWKEENKLTEISKANEEKIKAIYDCLKVDPKSLDIFAAFILNEFTFNESNINFENENTTIIGVINNMDEPDPINPCSCNYPNDGGSKRKKNRTNKRKTKRKTRKKKTKRKTKRKSKVRKSKKRKSKKRSKRSKRK